MEYCLEADVISTVFTGLVERLGVPRHGASSSPLGSRAPSSADEASLATITSTERKYFGTAEGGARAAVGSEAVRASR